MHLLPVAVCMHNLFITAAEIMHLATSSVGPYTAAVWDPTQQLCGTLHSSCVGPYTAAVWDPTQQLCGTLQSYVSSSCALSWFLVEMLPADQAIGIVLCTGSASRHGPACHYSSRNSLPRDVVTSPNLRLFKSCLLSTDLTVSCKLYPFCNYL